MVTCVHLFLSGASKGTTGDNRTITGIKIIIAISKAITEEATIEITGVAIIRIIVVAIEADITSFPGYAFKKN